MDNSEIQKLWEASIELKGNYSGVYFLFDGEELVYIGKSWNCFLRIAEHTKKDSDKIFTSWNYIHIEDEAQYKALARKLINKFSPRYNRNNRG